MVEKIAGNVNRPLRSIVRFALLVAGICAASFAQAQTARDYVSIVGSSTVYPFSIVVAEQFGRATKYKTPTIESTGSGGGFRLFCGGIGVQFPDITNASRRIKASELKDCASHGVGDVVEVKVGYDGIVIANSRSAQQIDITLEQIFLALAKNVPDPAGGQQFVSNPYRMWSEIDASLPASKIEVLGPPPTSGTRDAFLELAMEAGCRQFPLIGVLEGDDFQAACHTIREDGAYIDAGENDNLIVQKLDANPSAVGIFGYSFLDQNSDKVRGARISGVAPEFDAIANGDYPISRPLYFYVKSAHVNVIPGIREFLEEFTSDAAWGEFGYLSDRGLIPMSEGERFAVVAQVENLEPVNLTVETR
jgi:phosphate transport system substrate-binding protein